MERETTGIRRADAPPLAVDISTGTFSMAGSQIPAGHQTLAIANIAAGDTPDSQPTKPPSVRRPAAGGESRPHTGTCRKNPPLLGAKNERAHGASPLAWHSDQRVFAAASTRSITAAVAHLLKRHNLDTNRRGVCCPLH
jgi:hypothetical protein